MKRFDTDGFKDDVVLEHWSLCRTNSDPNGQKRIRIEQTKRLLYIFCEFWIAILI
jgi:hypothetical protein